GHLGVQVHRFKDRCAPAWRQVLLQPLAQVVSKVLLLLGEFEIHGRPSQALRLSMLMVTGPFFPLSPRERVRVRGFSGTSGPSPLPSPSGRGSASVVA